MVLRSKRYDSASKYAPPVLFAVFTAFGIATIIYGKFSNQSAFVVTSVPIAIMLAYMSITLFLKGLRLHDDQVGDNLYYMGFLFTLTSLGLSLYQFNDNQSIDGIVQNFGVAIGSTIAGVLLRVMYTQMRFDPIDIERETRFELAEMARMIRREMDETVRILADFRRANQQMMEEGFREVETATKNAGKAVADSIMTMATETRTPLEKVSNNLTNLLQETTNAIEESSSFQNDTLSEARKDITKNISSFGRSVDRIEKKFNDFSMPHEVIEVKFEPIIDKLETLINEQASQTQQLLKESNTNSIQLDKSLTSITQIAESLQIIASQIDMDRGSTNYKVQKKSRLWSIFNK